MRTVKPRPTPLEHLYARVGREGSERQEHLARADDNLTRMVGLIRKALERGEPVNLTECARRGQVTRQTLYDKLPAELIEDRPPASPTPSTAVRT